MNSAEKTAIVQKKKTECISVINKVLLIKNGDTATTLTDRDYSIICGALNFVIDALS